MRPALCAVGRRSVPLAVALAVAVPGIALAHGPVPAVPPDAANLLFGWSIEPTALLILIVAAVVWIGLVRKVDREHPANPVPRRRTAFFLAGLAVLAFALMSGIEQYEGSLFSVHMIQHLLLTLVAAPLIVLSAPITLLLRASTHETRTRLILPILHSRVVRAVTFPVVTWLIFAVTMWWTHFSPLFNAALEDPVVHELEHALYLTAALLFWWPAIGPDPNPWRMSHPVRAMYVFLQMPQNTFLAVTILNSTVVLYAHYATNVRPWGPSPLDDQQLAGGLMWILGDVLFLTVMIGMIAAWMAHEKQIEAAVDRREEAEVAAIRVREQRLAERLAAEREAQRP